MECKVLFLTVLVTFVQCKLLTPEDMFSCKAEAKLDSNILKQQAFPESSPEFQKFLECLFKKQDLLNEKGFVDYKNVHETASHIYNAAFAEKLAKFCENAQVGSNVGERAYHAAKCLHDNIQAATKKEKLKEESH